MGLDNVLDSFLEWRRKLILKGIEGIFLELRTIVCVTYIFGVKVAQ